MMVQPSGSQDTATIRKICNKIILHPEQMPTSDFDSLKLFRKIIQEQKGKGLHGFSLNKYSGTAD